MTPICWTVQVRVVPLGAVPAEHDVGAIGRQRGGPNDSRQRHGTARAGATSFWLLRAVPLRHCRELFGPLRCRRMAPTSCSAGTAPGGTTRTCTSSRSASRLLLTGSPVTQPSTTARAGHPTGARSPFFVVGLPQAGARCGGLRRWEDPNAKWQRSSPACPLSGRPRSVVPGFHVPDRHGHARRRQTGRVVSHCSGNG